MGSTLLGVEPEAAAKIEWARTQLGNAVSEVAKAHRDYVKSLDSLRRKHRAVVDTRAGRTSSKTAVLRAAVIREEARLAAKRRPEGAGGGLGCSTGRDGAPPQGGRRGGGRGRVDAASCAETSSDAAARVREYEVATARDEAQAAALRRREGAQARIATAEEAILEAARVRAERRAAGAPLGAPAAEQAADTDALLDGFKHSEALGASQEARTAGSALEGKVSASSLRSASTARLREAASARSELQAWDEKSSSSRLATSSAALSQARLAPALASLRLLPEAPLLEGGALVPTRSRKLLPGHVPASPVVGQGGFRAAAAAPSLTTHLPASQSQDRMVLNPDSSRDRVWQRGLHSRQAASRRRVPRLVLMAAGEAILEAKEANDAAEEAEDAFEAALAKGMSSGMGGSLSARGPSAGRRRTAATSLAASGGSRTARDGQLGRAAGTRTGWAQPPRGSAAAAGHY